MVNFNSYKSGMLVCLCFLPLMRCNNGGEENSKRGEEDSAETTVAAAPIPEKEVVLSREKQNSEPHKLKAYGAEYDWCLAPQAGNNYKAGNLFDGNKATAWAVNLSSAPFDCDALWGPVFNVDAERIDYIVFTNGYGKSDKVFHDNARVKQLTIARYGYDIEWEETKDYVLYSGPVMDSAGPQKLKVSPRYRHIPGKGKYQIVVHEIYSGNKWDDLCVSEIEFFGE